jgi:hypothetical protein
MRCLPWAVPQLNPTGRCHVQPQLRSHSGRHRDGWRDGGANLFALAIRAGLPARQLKAMVAAYSTAGSDLQYML